MNNYEKYFDLIEGKLKVSDESDKNISFDFRNLVLTYYENNIGKVDIEIRNHFFGLINYCLEGKNLIDAVNYKTEKDYEFMKLFSKEQYKLLNNFDAKILQEIYDKYKNNKNDWEIFISNINQFPLM